MSSDDAFGKGYSFDLKSRLWKNKEGKEYSLLPSGEPVLTLVGRIVIGSYTKNLVDYKQVKEKEVPLLSAFRKIKPQEESLEEFRVAVQDYNEHHGSTDTVEATLERMIADGEVLRVPGSFTAETFRDVFDRVHFKYNEDTKATSGRKGKVVLERLGKEVVTSENISELLIRSSSYRNIPAVIEGVADKKPENIRSILGDFVTAMPLLVEYGIIVLTSPPPRKKLSFDLPFEGGSGRGGVLDTLGDIFMLVDDVGRLFR